MREKILAQLQTKYAGVPKQFLGLWADKLAVKVTEEGQIQGVIDELDNLPVSITDLATEYQREGDRRATEAMKKKPTDQPQPPAGGQQQQQQDSNPVLAEIQALKSELAEFKKGQQQEFLGKQLAAKAAAKKIPAVFLKGRTVEKEEDLDTVLAEVEADFNVVKQDFANQGLLSTTPPVGGSPTRTADSIKADIAAWAKKNEPAPQQVAAPTGNKI